MRERYVATLLTWVQMTLLLLPFCAKGQPSDEAAQRLRSFLAGHHEWAEKEAQSVQAGSQEATHWLNSLFFVLLHPYCPHCPNPMPPDDPEQRLKGLTARASNGELEAEHILGAYYLLGQYVAQDPAQGLEWLGKAAAGGDSPSAFDLARIYAVGAMTPRDPKRAIQLYEAASGGLYGEMAMMELGRMYEFGLGVPRDFVRAKVWYERASTENDRKRTSPPLFFAATDYAAERLGALYALGEGVATDYEVAARWFIKAARNGEGYGGDVPVSQCALAIMYSGGLGVEADLTRAKFWLLRPNTATICS